MRWGYFFCFLLVCPVVFSSLLPTQYIQEALPYQSSYLLFLENGSRLLITEASFESIVQSASLDPTTTSLDTVAHELTDVAYIVPNKVLSKQVVLNDAFIADQYHINITDTFLAWEAVRGLSNITIAVIDTGTDYTHPDLVGNLWNNTAEVGGTPGVDDDSNGYIDDFYGWNTWWNNNSIEDIDGHGTHVAGTIAAVGNNSIGVSGMCPNCSIMTLRAGLYNFTVATIINAVDYAVANGADIISMSLGAEGVGCSGFASTFASAASQDVLLVAAAGNLNSDAMFYPAACDDVISVSSTDANDQKSSFSNYGTWIDVAAPGSSILATHVPGFTLSGSCSDSSYAPSSDGYGYCSGTSMAAPVVSGALGLYLSLYGPILDHDSAVALINATGVSPVSANPIGNRINTTAFLQLNSISELQSSCPVSTTGNWSITTDVVCENVSIYVNGKVEVVGAGNITLRNTTLSATSYLALNGTGWAWINESTLNTSLYSDNQSGVTSFHSTFLNQSEFYSPSNTVDNATLSDIVCSNCSIMLYNATAQNITALQSNITLEDGSFVWLIHNQSSQSSLIAFDNVTFNGSLGTWTNLNATMTNVTLTTQLVVGDNVSANFSQSTLPPSLSAQNGSTLYLQSSTFNFLASTFAQNASVTYDVPSLTYNQPLNDTVYNSTDLILEYDLLFDRAISYFNITLNQVVMDFNDTYNSVYYFDGLTYAANMSHTGYQEQNVTISYVDSNNVSNSTGVTYTLQLFVNGSSQDDSDADGVNDSQDSIIGNVSFLTSTFLNLSLLVNGTDNTSRLIQDNATVIVASSNRTLVSFDYNFTNRILNVTQIVLHNRTSQNKSQLFFRGVSLNASESKTLYLDISNDTRLSSLCIKDEEVSSFSAYSSNCTGSNEFYIQSIPFSNASYTITYANASNATLVVSGLRNSLLSQECSEDWSVTDWTTCSSSIQYRNATDNNACGTIFTKPSESQSCTVISGSSGGGGGGSGGGGGGSSSSSGGTAYIALPVEQGAVSSITYRRYYNVSFEGEATPMIFYLYDNGTALRLIDFNNTFIWFDQGVAEVEEMDWKVSLFSVGGTSAEVRITSLSEPEPDVNVSDLVLFPADDPVVEETSNESRVEEVLPQADQNESLPPLNPSGEALLRDKIAAHITDNISKYVFVGVHLVIAGLVCGLVVYFLIRRKRDQTI